MTAATTRDAFLAKVAKAVIDDIWDDPRALYVPVYRHDIKAESQANTTTDLPMLYIWNEGAENGRLRYSLSMNTGVVAGYLEKRLPRSDSRFTRARDMIAQTIHTSQNKVVQAACVKANCMPSLLYTTRDDMQAAISKTTGGMMRTVAESAVRVSEGLADQIEAGGVDMHAPKALRVIAACITDAAVPDYPTEGLDEIQKTVMRNGQVAVRKMVEVFAEKARGVAAKIESGEVEGDAPEALRYFANWVRSMSSDIPH